MTAKRENLTSLPMVLAHLPFYDVLRRYPPEVTVPFLRRACWYDDEESGQARELRAVAARVFAELPTPERDRQRARLVAYLSTRMVDVLFVHLYQGYAGFLDRHVTIDGRQAWERLKRQYGRAVLVSSHWGPYLATPGVLRALGESLAIPIDAHLVAPWQALAQHLGEDTTRTRYVGLPGEPATPRLAAALADGFSLFVTPDYSLGKAGGVTAPFLGRQLPVTTGPARLALEAGVPVVPVSLAATTPLTYRLTLGGALYEPGDPGVDVGPLTRSIYAALDAMVRQDPALWWGWTVYAAGHAPAGSPAGE